MPKLKSAAYQYHYPSFIRHHPNILRLIYVLNYLTQLRKWYVIREWQSLLLNSSGPATVVEFGCGEGQYLVPFTKQLTQSTFIAADYHLPSVELMNLFAIPNLKGKLINLETAKLHVEADIALCVGVLQYIAEDQHALENMYHSLQAKGQLLLYVPINGKIITLLYQFVFDNFEQYESINNRKRVYTESEIIQKAESAGFAIRKKMYTYGTAGKLSHELLNSCTTLIISGSYLCKFVAGFCLILFYPIILLLMMMDFLSKKSNGNGLLLILEK